MDKVIVEREFLRIKGKDALNFCQGMWTSDFFANGRETPTSLCGRSYLLNPKAKLIVVASFFIQNKDEINFSVPVGEASRVKSYLEKYVITEDVEIEILSDWTCVIYTEKSSGNKEISGCGIDVRDVYSLVGEAQKGEEIALPLSFEGQWYLETWSSVNSIGTCQVKDFDAWRIARKLPEWRSDFQEGQFLFDHPCFEGVSLGKGCFMGQEFVGRALNRGSLPKEWCRFQAENGKALVAGDLIDGHSRQKLGRLSTVFEANALGLIYKKFLGESLNLQDVEGNPLTIVKKDQPVD